MLPARLLQICLLLVGVVACSQSSQLNSDRQKGKKQQLEGNVSSSAPATTLEIDADALPITYLLDAPGVPEHCQVQHSGYQICMKCSPRELPIKFCAESQLDEFNADTRCSHDERQIVCDFDTDQYFNFDLERRSSLEEIYERVPLLVFGAKLVLLGQLEGFPREQKLVTQVLDTMQRYAKTFFTCGDLKPAVVEIAAVMKALLPDVPPAFILMFESQASTAVQFFQKVCEATFSDQVVVDWLAAMIKQVVSPSGLGGELNLMAILSALKVNPDGSQMSHILGEKDSAPAFGELETPILRSIELDSSEP